MSILPFNAVYKFVSSCIVDYIITKQRFVCMPGIETTASAAVKTWNMVRYYTLVNDRVRMSAYRKAIAQTVKGKVVLEIGVGALAPLSRMAAEAGARKIYAIEANSKAAAIARKLIQRDKLSDRIQIIEGFSQNINLPEKADVLIQELIGYMGSDEGMTSIIADAKKRLLKDDAVMVPQACRVFVVPVHGPHNFKKGWLVRLYEKTFYNVKKGNKRFHVWNFPRQQFISDPKTYENKVFAASLDMGEEKDIVFHVNSHSMFSGFLFWNHIILSDDNAIDCFQGTTWGAVYIQFTEEPLDVFPDDKIILGSSQDLRDSPRYQFSCSLVRKGIKEDLGTKRICWEE